MNAIMQRDQDFALSKEKITCTSLLNKLESNQFHRSVISQIFCVITTFAIKNKTTDGYI